jgi:diguanylate cyclase (GGDEF)-like protein
MRVTGILRWSVAVGMLLALVGILAFAPPAGAETLLQEKALCHAVTGRDRPDRDAVSLRFDCNGEPGGYQQSSLWLRARLDPRSGDRSDVVLMVHHSRFDRLAVAFSYADGVEQWQHVRSGDYGSHWRAGGQIAFEAPLRAVPVVAVTMRFDRLASHHLLHARLVTRGEGGVQSTALAALVGGALTLLLVGIVYTFSLAIALRRGFLAWHSAWATCMFFWGLIWSQIHLLALPFMAGTVSAQICTFLACLAVALAATSVATALGGGALPRFARWILLALAAADAAFGVPLALVRGAAIDALGGIASILILATLLATAASLAYAWRRRSAEARDFTWAWSMPMATLALIQFVNIDSAFWGGGSKLLILFVSAWQTLWLAIAATRRFANLRTERDSARAGEARANELARRDPLTGLLNRRGFVEAFSPLLDHVKPEDGTAALLLIDIDRFKTINDAYGHEVGDRVLHTVAERLGRWEGPMCAVGRLGGEEFAMVIAGIEGFALERFAESVRLEIAACDHREAIGTGIVTASIGVAETQAPADFQRLYRIADEALYVAKREGRNRIVLHRASAPPEPAPPPPAATRWA